jgi:hypothetical protein
MKISLPPKRAAKRTPASSMSNTWIERGWVLSTILPSST